MTTITINERTKAGKTLLELAKLLSISNKGVRIDEGIDRELILEEEKSVSILNLLPKLSWPKSK